MAPGDLTTKVPQPQKKEEGTEKEEGKGLQTIVPCRTEDLVEGPVGLDEQISALKKDPAYATLFDDYEKKYKKDAKGKGLDWFEGAVIMMAAFMKHKINADIAKTRLTQLDRQQVKIGSNMESFFSILGRSYLGFFFQEEKMKSKLSNAQLNSLSAFTNDFVGLMGDRLLEGVKPEWKDYKVATKIQDNLENGNLASLFVTSAKVSHDIVSHPDYSYEKGSLKAKEQEISSLISPDKLLAEMEQAAKKTDDKKFAKFVSNELHGMKSIPVLEWIPLIGAFAKYKSKNWKESMLYHMTVYASLAIWTEDASDQLGAIRERAITNYLVDLAENYATGNRHKTKQTSKVNEINIALMNNEELVDAARSANEQWYRTFILGKILDKKITSYPQLGQDTYDQLKTKTFELYKLTDQGQQELLLAGFPLEDIKNPNEYAPLLKAYQSARDYLFKVNKGGINEVNDALVTRKEEEARRILNTDSKAYKLLKERGYSDMSIALAFYLALPSIASVSLNEGKDFETVLLKQLSANLGENKNTPEIPNAEVMSAAFKKFTKMSGRNIGFDSFAGEQIGAIIGSLIIDLYSNKARAQFEAEKKAAESTATIPPLVETTKTKTRKEIAPLIITYQPFAKGLGYNLVFDDFVSRKLLYEGTAAWYKKNYAYKDPTNLNTFSRMYFGEKERDVQRTLLARLSAGVKYFKEHSKEIEAALGPEEWKNLSDAATAVLDVVPKGKATQQHIMALFWALQVSEYDYEKFMGKQYSFSKKPDNAMAVWYEGYLKVRNEGVDSISVKDCANMTVERLKSLRLGAGTYSLLLVDSAGRKQNIADFDVNRANAVTVKKAYDEIGKVKMGDFLVLLDSSNNVIAASQSGMAALLLSKGTNAALWRSQFARNGNIELGLTHVSKFAGPVSLRIPRFEEVPAPPAPETSAVREQLKYEPANVFGPKHPVRGIYPTLPPALFQNLFVPKYKYSTTINTTIVSFSESGETSYTKMAELMGLTDYSQDAIVNAMPDYLNSTVFKDAQMIDGKLQLALGVLLSNGDSAVFYVDKDKNITRDPPDSAYLKIEVTRNGDSLTTTIYYDNDSTYYVVATSDINTKITSIKVSAPVAGIMLENIISKDIGSVHVNADARVIPIYAEWKGGELLPEKLKKGLPLFQLIGTLSTAQLIGKTGKYGTMEFLRGGYEIPTKTSFADFGVAAFAEISRNMRINFGVAKNTGGFVSLTSKLGNLTLEFGVGTTKTSALAGMPKGFHYPVWVKITGPKGNGVQISLPLFVELVVRGEPVVSGPLGELASDIGRAVRELGAKMHMVPKRTYPFGKPG